MTAVLLGWSADVFVPSVFFGSHIIAYPAAIGLTALVINSWHSPRTWLKLIGGVAIGSALAWLLIFILELIAGLFSFRAVVSNISLGNLAWALSSIVINCALTLALMPLLIHFIKQRTDNRQYGSAY